MTRSEIPILSGAGELAGTYPAWLCDVWGVLHNGEAAFPQAVEALARYREAGGKVVLITNAPRPASSVRHQLDRVGVPNEGFDVMVTSGDVTRDLIAAASGAPVAHLGPDRDLPLFEGLDLEFAPLDRAPTIVCTGLFDDNTESPEDYAGLLHKAASRGAAMICANPDIVVQRGDDLVYCAGALAVAYEKLGGEVLFAGKPHRPIYELCFRRLAELMGRDVERREVLAIGDGMGTDVLGAERSGLDCLYVADGIHRQAVLGPDGKPDPSRLAGLFANSSRLPVAAVFGLSW